MTKTHLSTILAGVLVSPIATLAQAFSPPPDWDPMLMLNVSLDSSNCVTIAAAPTGTRLTIAPGAYDSTNRCYRLNAVTFDPAKPWAVLNGTAYSRVLGWYDPGTTGVGGDDFYSTHYHQLHGTNFVWIEKVGGSPEIKTYFVDEDVTGDPGSPYTPLFGTDNSPAKWRWDGHMVHNAYAVALTNITTASQVFFATYHLYIGDSAGNAVPGFGDSLTTWQWQGPATPVIPSLSLTVSNSQCVLVWQTTLDNLALYTADSVEASQWIPWTNSVHSLRNNRSTSVDLTESKRFFRLQTLP